MKRRKTNLLKRKTNGTLLEFYNEYCGIQEFHLVRDAISTMAKRYEISVEQCRGKIGAARKMLGLSTQRIVQDRQLFDREFRDAQEEKDREYRNYINQKSYMNTPECRIIK